MFKRPPGLFRKHARMRTRVRVASDTEQAPGRVQRAPGGCQSLGRAGSVHTHSDPRVIGLTEAGIVWQLQVEDRTFKDLRPLPSSSILAVQMAWETGPLMLPVEPGPS